MSRHFVFCIIKRNKFHDASNTKQNKMAQHLCKIQMHLHYNLMQNVNALACNATVSWNENNCQRSAMLSLLMGVSVKRNVWPMTVGRGGGDRAVLPDRNRQEGSPVVLLTA